MEVFRLPRNTHVLVCIPVTIVALLERSGAFAYVWQWLPQAITWGKNQGFTCSQTDNGCDKLKEGFTIVRGKVGSEALLRKEDDARKGKYLQTKQTGRDK